MVKLTFKEEESEGSGDGGGDTKGKILSLNLKSNLIQKTGNKRENFFSDCE